METLLDVIVSVAKFLLRSTISQAAYVYNLQRNIESLNRKWNELENKEKDVQTEIRTAENTGVMERTNEVNTWLQDFQNLKQKMLNDVPNPQQVESSQCLRGYWPKNCVSNYKLGKKIVKMLDEANEMLSKAGNMKIAKKQPPKPVENILCGETIGIDLMVHNIWNSLQDDNVGIIGLYGMGGVGKTTLMKRVHKELEKGEHSFDLVLLLVVSKECEIEKIMTKISLRLGIDVDFWNRSGLEGRPGLIYERLKEKKFVLMLDDLWDKLELRTIGVPDPKESNNKSKVVFTTRSSDVCDKMKAQLKWEVKCLSNDEAFDLFRKNVGEETLRCHTKISEIAREMSNECGGLPLALNIVGSAMAGEKNYDKWMAAKRDLKSSSSKALNLMEEVFCKLEFSYDKLREAHKLCFLYCALYPEDYEVDVNKLIDRWIAEGFLGQYDTSSVHDMYVDGKNIIYDLKRACLLQEVDNLSSTQINEKKIKMHDVIRDMALWLARDKNKNKDKIVVEREAFSMSEMDSKRLNVVERISIILHTRNFVKKEWKVPICTNLKILCVKGVKVVSTNFLSNCQFLKSLKVLDVSSNFYIETLSSDIGELINLEFINLSETSLTCLPIGMKKLKNLRILLMEDMSSNYDVCNVIHLEVIESLERLKVFRFSRRYLCKVEKEIPFLEKLESLPKMEELCIELYTSSGMSKLLNSTKLLALVRKFCYLTGSDPPLEMSSLFAFMTEMKHLDCIRLLSLNLMDGSPVSDNKCNLANLRQVTIFECDSITHLTWLRHAPVLEFLDVSFCDSIEHVVKDDDDNDSKSTTDINIFGNLAVLYLNYMLNLVSIHKRSFHFPSLKYIYVDDCPKLRKLPFSSTFASNNNLIEINGKDNWWESLEWDDTTIQNLLHSKFNPFIIRS